MAGRYSTRLVKKRLVWHYKGGSNVWGNSPQLTKRQPGCRHSNICHPKILRLKCISVMHGLAHFDAVCSLCTLFHLLETYTHGINSCTAPACMCLSCLHSSPSCCSDTSVHSWSSTQHLHKGPGSNFCLLLTLSCARAAEQGFTLG